MADAEVVLETRIDALERAGGDWVVGENRVNGALRSGLETGEAIREGLF